jgi:exopolysaccharide biosynthesis polyprenyl glycosylphosphotransferase
MSLLDAPVDYMGHVIASSVTAEDVGGMQGAPIHHWRPSSLALRVRATAGLVVLDVLAIWIAFGVVALARGALSNLPSVIFTLALTGTYLILAPGQRTYHASTLLDPFLAIRRGLRTLLFAIGAMTIAVFYLKSGETFPRLTVGLGSGGAIILMIAFRYFFITRLESLIGGNPFQSALILDGVQQQPAGSYSIVLTADALFDPEAHDPNMYHRLATTLTGVDRVVVSCPAARRRAWVGALQGANIQGEIIIPELADLAPSGMGPDRKAPSVIVASGPLTLIDRMIKRGFDLALAATAILILAPVLLLTACAIKLDSTGPILFKQRRIGRGNQLFYVLKFRSMRTEKCDSDGNRSTARDDDRITRVGNIIRKFSVDELPQLFNVLYGDMSIVGPRPHATGSRAADKLFWEVDKRYWHRHAIKPGLTGLAQVRGHRGATVHESDLQDRLRSDLEYLQGWSIWRDIKIVVLTMRVIFHDNAY